MHIVSPGVTTKKVTQMWVIKRIKMLGNIHVRQKGVVKEERRNQTGEQYNNNCVGFRWCGLSIFNIQ